MLLLLSLLACNSNDGKVGDKSLDNAALELYSKYADNTNLTVAYLGDLNINEKSIDALMLQANNEGDWETLKQDFVMTLHDTANINRPSEDNVVSVGVGIETAFLDESVFDTLTDISQIPEEDLEKFTLIVADKILEIMSNFQTPDSLLPNTAIIVGQGEIEHENTDNTYDDYIMTVARSIVIGMINDRIQPDTTRNLSMQQQMDWNHSIMDDAQTHGHIGYITAVDNDERALWLFFYDDQEECNTIINHISEDMIIK